MSTKYASPQLFKVYQSSLLVKALWLIHIIALAATLLSAVVFTSKLVIVVLIAISLYFYLHREAKNSDYAIRHSDEFGWEFAYSDADYNAIDILPSTVLTPYLIVLHIKQQNRKKQTILICKDALKHDDFRKLMVELKMSGIKRDVS